MFRKKTVAVAMVAALMLTACSSSESSKKDSKKDKDEKTTVVTQKDSADKSEKETDKGSKEETKKADDKEKFAKADPVDPKATVPQYSYTATKTGTIATKYLYTNGGLAYEKAGEDTYRVYLSDGKLFPEEGAGELSNGEYLGGGLYEVRKNVEGNVNSAGLITSSGEILIPFEAASVEWIKTEDETKHRYVKAIYATEVTTNKEEAMIRFTKNQFSWNVSEGDTLYKGYVKIYDTVNKKFVSDKKFTNPDSYCFSEVGDSFIYTDENKVTTLYSADGKELASGDKYNCSTDGTVFIVSDKEYKYTVYNSAGEKLQKSDFGLSTLRGQGGILAMNDSSKGEKYLVDYAGNRISDKSFKTAYKNCGGIIEIDDESGVRVLMHPDGTEIVSNQKSFYDIIPGYEYYQAADGKYVIVTADGAICTDCQDNYNLVAYDAEGKYFVWNNKSYSLQLDTANTRYLEIGLVKTKTAEGKYALYDLFTGNQLLEGVYDDIKTSGDLAYGYNKDAGSWDVYKLTSNLPYDD